MGNSAIGRGTAVEENKVKASSSDATPDYLDGKVGSSMQVLSDELHVIGGTSGDVLTANGAGVAPTMQTPSGISADATIKGWVKMDGTGTIAINDSFNVSSIVDDGAAGQYSVYWDTDFTNALYSLAGICSGGIVFDRGTTTVAKMSMILRQHDGATFDSSNISIIAIGDQ